jgi:hypothetical protein
MSHLLVGLGLSAAFTAIIALTAVNLTGFAIVGKTLPFAYPWRLTQPSALARLTAWGGYLLHNLLVWAIIYRAKRQTPRYDLKLRWFNWSLAGVNLAFIGLHVLQTHYFYDGLAQDVPEISALGSVALLLIVIVILETPRRGLILGKKVRFEARFMQIVRLYHGYLFAWATIYTFWYHPTEGTPGHLLGFFYMFMLLTQSALIFNRAHLNKWWTFTLEAFVLVHGVSVALAQGGVLWPMFAFGFAAMVVLTQMYGLGLSTWVRRGLAASFVVAVVASYAAMGRLAQLSEVVRIPVLDYAVVFLVYGIYLGLHRGLGLLRGSGTVETASD